MKNLFLITLSLLAFSSASFADCEQDGDIWVCDTPSGGDMECESTDGEVEC
ncbi:hypothetical protein [Vibrio sp. ER1A]|uniref:hypothetical protein n=1 Tax=Vibrio sp. ER1A TaxID=1517681 RepID=UPI001363CA57|nr:hypothetical protein [Vibrio sp. ER1A]